MRFGHLKEVRVKVGSKQGRIDWMTEKKAIEIERSGNPRDIRWACLKLKASRKRYKILRVPDWHVDMAREIASKVSSSITVQNLSGD